MSDALATYCSVLEASFQDDSSADPADELIYRYVVLPALELPLGNATGESADRQTDLADRKKLAKLWAAKGRLLERDPKNVLLGDAEGGPVRDRYTNSGTRCQWLRKRIRAWTPGTSTDSLTGPENSSPELRTIVWSWRARRFTMGVPRYTPN